MDQHSLFDDDHELVANGGPDAVLHRGAIPDADARELFAELRAEVAWNQDHIRMYGDLIPLPRLTAWVGDPGRDYTYSGIEMHAQPWSGPLEGIRTVVEQLSTSRFNSVLCNLYRDGHDGLAWHSDDETELGDEPVIASANLGATRRFLMRRKDDHRDKVELSLRNGDVLIMSGTTQEQWEHSVPKTAKPTGERINLTFRTVVV